MKNKKSRLRDDRGAAFRLRSTTPGKATIRVAIGKQEVDELKLIRGLSTLAAVNLALGNVTFRERDSAFERRSIGRTKIAKGALLFFSTQGGVRTCFIKDVTNVGAGIRAQDLPALPLGFELSFDSFGTSRKCRLIWRDGDFIGLAFENLNLSLPM